MQIDGKIDHGRLARLLRQEEETYTRDHPKSLQLYRRAQQCLVAGVPMHWMVRR